MPRHVHSTQVVPCGTARCERVRRSGGCNTLSYISQFITIFMVHTAKPRLVISGSAINSRDAMQQPTGREKACRVGDCIGPLLARLVVSPCACTMQHAACPLERLADCTKSLQGLTGAPRTCIRGSHAIWPPPQRHGQGTRPSHTWVCAQLGLPSSAARISKVIVQMTSRVRGPPHSPSCAGPHHHGARCSMQCRGGALARHNRTQPVHRA